MQQACLSTTQILTHWEHQSAAAERMCADILRLDGFQDLDPQSPRGGPDGGKDILCSKGGVSFVAACYFANEPRDFSKIKGKFEDDLEASLKHKRDGIIFLTNQHLTPGERTTLEKAAAAKGKRALMFHREYLRVCLDSPSGYGVRLKHLRIPLSTEEQFAYFASSREAVSEAIAENTRALERLSSRIDRSTAAQIGFMAHTTAVVLDAVRNESKEDVEEMLKASSKIAMSSASVPASSSLTAQLSVALICYVHRLLVPTSFHLLGKLRETQVWLADATGTVNEAVEVPSWDKVPNLLEALVSEWNGAFPELAKNHKSRAIPEIARFFHQLLTIHPFIDGNGRVAREIAFQQIRDLLGVNRDILLDNGPRYYSSLAKADAQDYSELEALFREAVTEAK